MALISLAKSKKFMLGLVWGVTELQGGIRRRKAFMREEQNVKLKDPAHSQS